jgi:ATP-binding cassette, subfamily B (MDR/TAP), member 1
VQDAISEKLGNLVHYMATFVAGFVVGFRAAWQLALVTLAVVPLIAVIGGLSAAALARLSSRSQGALSEATNIAEQAVAQIRVVIAHRLSTIRKADLVAVLHGGAVSEMGTHEELMGKGEESAYGRLIRMQEQAHQVAARRSSARNSVSSPIRTRNSSYGRSPYYYSRRLSDLNLHDDMTAFRGGEQCRDKRVGVALSSFLRLAKMNSPELGCALVGSIGSMVCGSFSTVFAYVLSTVLSVYYDPSPQEQARKITRYCYLLLGMSSAALVFNTVQHAVWDC